MPVHLEAGNSWRPEGTPAFVRLLVVFALNAIATAATGTALVLFFIQDRRLQSLPSIQRRVSWSLCFMCAASMPNGCGCGGAAGAYTQNWLLGMVLSVLAFAGAVRQ
ncbi:hypothetical protein [Candidatus Aalborgicola defluviihabitans]|uniref:hypothetical protein n=1 Tax=Candidatus Aalborgicola defluviihabitans TaxID=3386187 RepID=UPI00390B7593|nr:hypothetical protein [Burkholderiales bacterium]